MDPTEPARGADKEPEVRSHPTVQDASRTFPIPPCDSVVSPQTLFNLTPIPYDFRVHSLPVNISDCTHDAPKSGRHSRAEMGQSEPSACRQLRSPQKDTAQDLSSLELEMEERELRLKWERLKEKRAALDGQRTTPSDESPTKGGSTLGALDKLDSPNETMLTRLVAGLSLPKLEIEPFSGLPGQYVSFIEAFRNNVEPYLLNHQQRLSYLLHYCRGAAKDAVRHCVLLPKETGYLTALEILKNQFGRPHQIIRAVTEDLFNGPIIRSGDLVSMEELLRQMRSCHITLTQLGRSADLDCVSNLTRVVKRLPKPIQIKWAEIAESLLSIGKEATFEDLLALVERRVSIASTEYGSIAFESSSTFKNQPPSRRIAALKSNDNAKGCTVCGAPHSLDKCPDFLALTVQKRWQHLKDHKRCFRCLKTNHRIRECKSGVVCQVGGCGKYHHPSLHPAEGGEGPQPESSARVCTSYSLQSSGVQLGFVPVRLHGPKGSVVTNAFIDNGSDCTLIDNRISDQLGLKRKPTSLRISTLHGSKMVQCGETNVHLSSLNGEYTLELKSIVSIDQLPVQKVDRRITDLSRWQHLRDVHLEKPISDRVGLLIGCDIPQLHTVLDQRIGTNYEPFAVKTTLGWLLRGPTGPCDISAFRVNAIIAESPPVESLLRRLYDNEFQDQGDPESIQPSVEDRNALAFVERETCILGERYEVPVPWKSTPHLPDNSPMATSRLLQLKRRLLRDPLLKTKYIDTMSGHIAKGHFSPSNSSVSRWFLPHHPVINPRKPEKLRVVFDCAASFKGTSLNDELLQGPDLTNSLTGVLLRFRRFAIALSADIREMFLQVAIPKRDRWAFSLLWWPDNELNQAPEVYEWNVHPFGAKSSPFCANYALRRTISDHIHSFEPNLHPSVVRDFYVDDYLTSVENEEMAKVIVSELPKLLTLGGFELVKWISNSGEVMAQLDPEACACPLQELYRDDSCQRTLGIMWHIVKDAFVFASVEPPKHPTRRSLLAFVASIFDPLGFVAPIILPGKLILQSLCHQKFGWDNPLDDRALQDMSSWIGVLETMKSIEIQRCLIFRKESSADLELHVFSDASEAAFGAVAYLRYTTGDTIHCRFLMGKSRVAPLKFVTVPRLELTAALVAANLSSHILKELDLPVRRVILWTDSAIVLRYLTNCSSRYVTFVANRVRRILELTDASQWRHVPTSSNPADIASRKLTPRSVQKMSLWFNGPDFLRNDEASWPNNLEVPRAEDSELEVKRVVAVTSTRPDHEWLRKLCARSRNWSKLLRCLAWLARFKQYLFIKCFSNVDARLNVGNIKVQETIRAGRDVVRIVQMVAFGQSTMGSSNTLRASTCSELSGLKPYTYDGMLCLGGRIQRTIRDNPLPILPSNHVVTEMVINHHHELSGHSGASYVLASVRREFWVIKGMATVRRVLKQCGACRLLNARQCGQAMAMLPMFRVESDFYPFIHTGLDYFGPFRVKFNRSEVKRFGCLFTCMQSRAIHIEVAHSMSTDSFLMALTRFISRRGKPAVIYSDNGSNFVGAEEELRKLCYSLDQRQIQEAMLSRQIDWRFNPPSASHRGGVWERMIRSVRRVLTHLVKEQVVTDEVLLTCLAEAERIINDRPLIPVYDDPDQPDVLRPSDLLLLRPNYGLAVDDIPLRERLTRRWRQALQLANFFWKRWKREYLPTLQSIHKWLHPQRNLKTGDLVLITKTDSPRGHWPKGVVIETFPGPDGLVRQVSIKTANGIIRRDVRSLCLLEGAED